MLRTFLVALVAIFFSSINAFASETPQFTDYFEKVYQGALVTPKLAKSLCGPKTEEDPVCFWDFRTRLRGGTAQEGITFGGKYTLVEWGCGTSCQSGAIVDRKTGQMIWLPTAALGFEFHAHSRLLIVNPEPERYADSDGKLPDWLYREFYEIKNGEFVLVLQDRGDSTQTSTKEALTDTPHPLTCIQQESLLGKEEVSPDCENE